MHRMALGDAVLRPCGMVSQMEGASGDALRRPHRAAQGHGHTAFLQYYSVGVQDGGAAGADRKPGKENGLTGRQEGPHSVFGIIAQAMERFGRSKRHILWKISYAELMLMNTDVSRYVTKEELLERERKRRPDKFTTEYFQTKLGG